MFYHPNPGEKTIEEFETVSSFCSLAVVGNEQV